jgi:thioredoxin-dependent peroxiredoxin
MAKKKSVRKPGAAKKTAKKAVKKATAKNPAPAKKVAAQKGAAKQPAAKRLASKKAAPKPSAASQAKPAKAAGPAWPQEGSKAPDFTAVAHDGSQVTLSALKGRPVVLYFYPKDDTPGCTVEACGFRDAHAQFGRHKAVVLGVSPDSPRSHVKFREKFKLPFTLLADEDHSLAERYGAWREKSMYGKTYLGVARSTFVIDAKGRIAKAFTTVKPEGHDREVLAALAALSGYD